MSMNIVVPEMGESVVDARVARWLKNQGDPVAVGEPLVELETDKVDIEVSAARAGILATIAHAKGDDVKIGDVLGTIESPAGGASAARPPAAPAATGGKPPRPPEPAGGKPRAEAPAAPARTAPASTPPPGPEPTATPAATPSARRLAREQHVELSTVKAEGPRVTTADIQKRLGPPSAAEPAPRVRVDERVRMSKRRATIAKRLVEAQQTAAMLTTFNEVDMTLVMALRERQKLLFKEKYGVSLGIASFFVKAAIAALRDFPRLNAEVQGDEMVLKHYYDMGIAVAAAEGLVVPVLRDADRLTFAEIEMGIRGFVTRATDGTLTLDDLRGGTFSITNGGVFGSLLSTPILNPPQVGILGLHAIKDRAVGVGGQVVLRPMMYVALTYDHRIVDGAEAVRFLVRVKDLVEDPAVLLVES
jgi:2-oxoglutarate dehydrogenase E2 component (dihydrolipoamide succinyltransferase)